jgi:hypothetical protein
VLGRLKVHVVDVEAKRELLGRFAIVSTEDSPFLFIFLLRQWFTSPGGALPLLRWLSRVGVGSFWASLLCSHVFFMADDFPLWFASFGTCYMCFL